MGTLAKASLSLAQLSPSLFVLVIIVIVVVLLVVADQLRLSGFWGFGKSLRITGVGITVMLLQVSPHPPPLWLIMLAWTKYW